MSSVQLTAVLRYVQSNVVKIMTVLIMQKTSRLQLILEFHHILECSDYTCHFL
jgi:hypothetical protein